MFILPVFPIFTFNTISVKLHIQYVVMHTCMYMFYSEPSNVNMETICEGKYQLCTVSAKLIFQQLYIYYR